MKPEDLKTISASFGTPAYVFDLDELSARAAAIRNILDPRIGLCYSIKANPFLVPAMDRLIGLLEVCSPGELEICIRNQVKPEHILLSGVTKTEADVERALQIGVRLLTCESLYHAELINQAAERHGLTIPVLLRLTAGSQFGMDATVLEQIIQSRSQYSHLDIKGIHYFSGTQRKKLQDQRKELLFLADYCDHLHQDLGFDVEKIEYGTGLYFPYFENEDRSDTLAPIRELAPDLAALAEKVSLTIEMGRFFASSCGTFLTSVVDTKCNKGQWYAILDGGIHQINYYGGSMGMRTPVITRLTGPDSPEMTETATWMLCGSLCTTADVIVRAYPTASLSRGDVLAFHNCGAYSVTEAPALFLSRDMPAILLYENGNVHEVRSIRPSWTLNTEAL